MSSKVVSKKVVNMSLRQKSTQLIDPEVFDASRVVFDDPVAESIPGQPGTNYRINLGYKNPDNTEGFLILGFDTCYCFGISENVDLNSKALNGYNAAISLYDINGATPKQQKTVEALQEIIQQCKKNILKDSTQEAMGKVDDDDKILESDLRKINLIFWKKENGKPNPEMGGTIYPKLIWSKSRIDSKTGKEIPPKMLTRFFNIDEVDENGEPVEVDPLDYVGKRFIMQAAVKIESIFVGSRISIQMKIYEAFVREAESGPQRLLVYKPESSSDIVVVTPPEDSSISFDEPEKEEAVSEEKEEVKPVVASSSEKKTLTKKVRGK
jgi:hypothetical protein